MVQKTRQATWGFLCIGMIIGIVSPVQNACMQDTLTDLSDISASPEEVEDEVQKTLGIASWYSEHDPGIRLHTASGKRFDSKKLWAASWDYPFGTKLRVTNPKTAKSVVVVVEDRGPAKHLNRKLDLTKMAFSRIALLGEGLIEVEITEIPN